RLPDFCNIRKHQHDAIYRITEVAVGQDAQHVTLFAVLDAQFLLDGLPRLEHLPAELLKFGLISSRYHIGKEPPPILLLKTEQRSCRGREAPDSHPPIEEDRWHLCAFNEVLQ